MRAAIYARMSTDKQSADSPADQIARCREFAARHSWQIVESLVISEAGVSGASRHNRPGLLGLVARIDEWDVLLCWDSSRLARDSEDLGWIRNRLRAHRCAGYEVSTGLDLENVGAKVLGVMAEEYLVKLRADTRRGLRGRAERGLATGGTPYGYCTEPVALDEHGRAVEGAGYRLLVREDEAATVRRIFDLYLGGANARTIARRLNAEAVPSPRARAQRGRRPSWAPTAIREMLRNPTYKGERVFNRSEWIKDHETGRRRRFERPAAEWVREQDESLRIVSDAVWSRVQDVKRERASICERDGRGRIVRSHARAAKRRHLLSGLLECGICGGSFFAVRSSGIYACGWHRDRGPDVCGSMLRVPRAALEERILGAIRERVLTPEAVEYVVERAFALVLQEMAAGPDPGHDRKRLAEIEVEMARAVDLAVHTGGRFEAVERKLTALEVEKGERLARLARATAATPSQDALRDLVRDQVLGWRALFDASPEDGRQALTALLAGERMRVYADEERAFRVEGVLHVPLTNEPPGTDASGRFDSVVAGGGFEPPTSGL